MKTGLKNKKKLIITGLIMFLLLTAFWSWNMPKLINADLPFIELKGSIGESIGSAKIAYEKATLVTNPDIPVITETPEPTEIPDTSTEKDEVRIVIGDDDMSGSGEKITADGSYITSLDDLKVLLDSENFEGKDLVLVDNYAETKIFRALIEYFKSKGTEYRTQRTEEEE